MAKAASKLTSRGRTTIPKAVRKALQVGEGDGLTYDIRGHHVILTKTPGPSHQTPLGLFSEWASENDGRAYRLL